MNKLFIITFLSFVSFFAQSQGIRQDNNSKGVNWMEGNFRRALIPPRDTIALPAADSGALARRPNGVLYMFTGYKWLPAGGDSTTITVTNNGAGINTIYATSDNTLHGKRLQQGVGITIATQADSSIKFDYILPTASATVLGGIKVGERLTITNGVLSANLQSGGGGSFDSVNAKIITSLTIDTSRAVFTPVVPNSSTAMAYKFDTRNTFITDLATIASFRTGGIEMMALRKNTLPGLGSGNEIYLPGAINRILGGTTGRLDIEVPSGELHLKAGQTINSASFLNARTTDASSIATQSGSHSLSFGASLWNLATSTNYQRMFYIKAVPSTTVAGSSHLDIGTGATDASGANGTTRVVINDIGTVELPAYGIAGAETKAATISNTGLIGTQHITRKFNVKDNLAKGDGVQRFTGNTIALSTTFTDDTGPFTSADVGKTIEIDSAGTSGRRFTTTIGGFTNSSTITLTAAPPTTVSLNKYAYGTNDQTAIQNTINACNAAGGGTVYFPNGVYFISGELQTNIEGGNPNSQLYIPTIGTPSSFAYWQGRTHIVFEGETPPNFMPASNAIDYSPSYKGAVLKSTITGSGTAPSVIGTKAAPGYFENINFNFLTVKNLSILVAPNTSGTGPTVGGINGYYTASLFTDNVVVSIDGSMYTSVNPTAEVAGIIPSKINAETFSTLRNSMAIGFKYGMVAGEHTELDQVTVWGCFAGLAVIQNFHAMHGSRVNIDWCLNSIYVPDVSILGGMIPVGKAVFNIDQLNVEVKTSGPLWFDNYTYVVKDFGNYGRANLNYHIVQAHLGINNALFNKQGGDSIFARQIGLPVTGTGGTGSPGGSTTQLQINIAGAFAGSSKYTVDEPNGSMTIAATNPYLFLNNTSTTGQAAIYFKKNGVNKWQIGSDFTSSGVSDFYVYDQTSTKAKIYINPAGDISLGGSAYTAPNFFMLDNGKVDLINYVGIGTASGGALAPLHIKKSFANNYGQLVLHDPAASGSASTIYQSFYDASNVRQGLFGFGRYGDVGSGDPNFYYVNQQTSGAHVWRNSSATLLTLANNGTLNYETDISPSSTDLTAMPKVWTKNATNLTTGTLPNARLSAAAFISRDTANFTHIVGRGAAPSIAAGSGAGTAPTVSLFGTDLAGEITILTGTTPSANSIIATITYNVAYAANPFPDIKESNGAAADALGIYVIRTSASQFQIGVTGTALAAATSYKWIYKVVQ